MDRHDPLRRVSTSPHRRSRATLRVARLAALLSCFGWGTASAQTFFGADLSLRSSGSADRNFWQLDETGYVGTYFTVEEGSPVTIGVNATGFTSDGVAPKLNLVVADQTIGFDVTGATTQYEGTFDLPAGTYFARAEFANNSPNANRNLTIASLSFDGAASVSNTSSRTVNESNALATSDTYIEHFRQGSSRLTLAGTAPGTPVTVRMRRNEFNFGTYVTGFNANVFVGDLGTGETTSNRARYQDFITTHFNMLVPSNMGKWQPTENSEGVPTMGNVDAIIDFANANNMAFRQHNLAWGAQQPGWVNSLIDDALSGSPTVAAQAKADLRQAVTDRIAYYVGDGDSDQDDGDRTRFYEELDVVNEILREKTYFEIFGVEGIAEIYKLTQDAVQAAGADTLLMTNEYNIFNFAGNPLTGASDNYANWYRQHVEDLNDAGFGDVVTGIGIQAQTNPAPDGSPTSGQNHNPARMNEVLQNLAILGLPMTLTEFSVPSEAFGVTTTPQRAAEVYTETLRMMFGSPLGRSMLIWEPWPPNDTDQTSIVDSDWNLTTVGEAFVALLEEWTTDDQTLTVGPDGAIEIEGFYGEYDVVVDEETLVFDHSKEVTAQVVSTATLLPGDFNDDGVVDAADYTVWRDAVATQATLLNDPTGLPAGPDQYSLWQAFFGQSDNGSGGVRSTAVPEPSVLALGLAATACSLAIRRTNRSG